MNTEFFVYSIPCLELPCFPSALPSSVSVVSLLTGMLPMGGQWGVKLTLLTLFMRRSVL